MKVHTSQVLFTARLQNQEQSLISLRETIVFLWMTMKISGHSYAAGGHNEVISKAEANMRVRALDDTQVRNVVLHCSKDNYALDASKIHFKIYIRSRK